MRPVLVVHGIFDPAFRVLALVRALRARGIAPVRRARLPALGTTRIEALAETLAERIAIVCTEHGVHDIDLVGHSMGALVTHCYLQRFAASRRVRTFVSISGPHRGTRTAYLLPLAGVRQMRPGSAFLRQLGHDVSAWKNVTVHCVYTPFDALIIPATSSVLDGAASVHRMPVAAHHLMMRDRRVQDLVARLLREGHEQAAVQTAEPST